MVSGLLNPTNPHLYMRLQASSPFHVLLINRTFDALFFRLRDLLCVLKSPHPNTKNTTKNNCSSGKLSWPAELDPPVSIRRHIFKFDAIVTTRITAYIFRLGNPYKPVYICYWNPGWGGVGSKLCSFPISNEEAPLKDMFVASLSFHFWGELQYGKVGPKMKAKEVKVSPCCCSNMVCLVLFFCPIIQSKLSAITMPRTRSLCLQPAVKVLVIAHKAQTNPNRPLFAFAKKLPNSWYWHRHGGLEINLGVSKNSGFYPPNHPLKNRVFPLYKLSNLGYHYFWKHPSLKYGMHELFWRIFYQERLILDLLLAFFFWVGTWGWGGVGEAVVPNYILQSSWVAALKSIHITNQCSIENPNCSIVSINGPHQPSQPWTQRNVCQRPCGCSPWQSARHSPCRKVAWRYWWAPIRARWPAAIIRATFETLVTHHYTA